MSEISAGFTLEFCGDNGKPVASAWTSAGFRLAALPHPGDLVLADFLPAELAPPSFPFAEVAAVQHFPGTGQQAPSAVVVLRLAAITSLEQLRPLTDAGWRAGWHAS